MNEPIYVCAVGMACPVGLNWQAASAAVRARINRKRESSYLDDRGGTIVASYVDGFPNEWIGARRWLTLLELAIKDATRGCGMQPEELPLFLSADGHSSTIARMLRARSICTFAEGAAGGLRALSAASEALLRRECSICLVAAADSLISAPRLLHLDQRRRLFTEDNADGVIPGEAAVCLLVSNRSRGALARIRGLGFSTEPALLSNDLPLRAEGSITAARLALADAGLTLADVDFRVSDAAGEGYAFKEQALVVSRLLDRRKEQFPLWLPAETLGDTGAAAALCGVALVTAGFQRGYAPGPRALGFASDEGGSRAAVILDSAQS